MQTCRPADLQASGYIDQFFVAGAYARRGAARALMAHLHQAAGSRGITRLFADVSLTAEPFFSREQLCGSSAPAGGGARGGSGECADGQGAATLLILI